MEKVIIIVHVLIAVAMIALILLQQGKGADAGASFGSGASQTVFGSQGSGNFLSRATAFLAALFFVTSFGLAIVAKEKASTFGGVDLPTLVEDYAPVAEVVESDIPVADTVSEIPASDVPVVEAQESAEIPVADVVEAAVEQEVVAEQEAVMEQPVAGDDVSAAESAQ